MRLSKYGFTFIITCITISCEAYTFQLEPGTVNQWLSLFHFSNYSETVILDIDSDDDVIFKENFIKSIHRDQSVFIISGREIPPSLPTDQRMKDLIKKKVNIVLGTTTINSSLLDVPILKFVLKSKWSLLLILVTTPDIQYSCTDGKFSKEYQDVIEVFMNDMWHKHRMMLVVVAFPRICPDHFIIYNGSKPTNQALYNKTIALIDVNKNIQLTEGLIWKMNKVLARNYPLRGNIFNRFPTAIANCSSTELHITNTMQSGSGGYCGMDALIMSDVLRHFRFNLSLPKLPPGYNQFGYQLADGTVVGTLDSVAKGDVDISFNSRFIENYVKGDRNYKFLYPIGYDSLCALMRLPDEKPLWKYPYATHCWQHWLIIFTMLITIGVFMWISAKFESKIYNREASSLFFYITNSINAGLFGFFLIRRNDLLIFRGVCLYSSIIFLAQYQGFINYMFTTRWYSFINTLPQLVAAGTTIQTSPAITKMLMIPANDVQAILKTRTSLQSSNDTNAYEYVLNHPNSASLERKSDAILMGFLKYTNDNGRPMIYVVNECFRSFHLSYITNPDFPFESLLHLFMMRLDEAGLPDMYYTWTSRSLGLDVTLPSMGSEPRPIERITLRAQVIAFSLLVTGYLLSAIVLVIETWVMRTRLYPYLP